MRKNADRTIDTLEAIRRGEQRLGREDGLEAPPRHVSVLRDMRFEERPRYKDEAPVPAKPSPSEMAAKREIQLAKARVTPDGHFCCSACGGKVVRPPEVSASAWAQRRRCDACVAADRQPPAGKRHCRRCGKLFKRKKIVRWGKTRLSTGCERFCRRHLPPEP